MDQLVSGISENGSTADGPTGSSNILNAHSLEVGPPLIPF